LIIIIALGIIISLISGIITVLLIQKKKKEGTMQEPNYLAFFIMGICFLPMGIIFTTAISSVFIIFICLGACYIAIGLAHLAHFED